MTHELKCWPEYFEQILTGYKTFEVRKNDRDYKVGDELFLREWDYLKMEYTGRELKMLITYILVGGSFGIQKEYVVMSII